MPSTQFDGLGDGAGLGAVVALVALDGAGAGLGGAVAVTLGLADFLALPFLRPCP
jgi:hypothetical protein